MQVCLCSRCIGSGSVRSFVSHKLCAGKWTWPTVEQRKERRKVEGFVRCVTGEVTVESGEDRQSACSGVYCPNRTPERLVPVFIAAFGVTHGVSSAPVDEWGDSSPSSLSRPCLTAAFIFSGVPADASGSAEVHYTLSRSVNASRSVKL